MELKDKTVLITGGRRVGQVVAQELAGAGMKVVMTYLTDRAEVPAAYGAYPVNLSDEASLMALTGSLAKDIGPVDALINMASIFVPDGEVVTREHIEKIFSVNAFGNMQLSRWFAQQAQKNKLANAPVVSFIDWAVDHPYAAYDTYIASKAAIRHYLMALQTSFAGTIRVVNIHPGMILEPPNFPAAEKEMIITNTPVQTIGTPEQAAKLVRTALELDYWVDNVHLAGGQQWRHRLEKA